MPRYHLVAARDGDIIDTIGEWPDEQTAELWASGLLALEFGLDPEVFDTFDYIAAETDGCRLEELDPDRIAEAAIELLGALAPLISKRRFEPLLKQGVGSLTLIGKAAELSRILIEEGYRR